METTTQAAVVESTPFGANSWSEELPTPPSEPTPATPTAEVPATTETPQATTPSTTEPPPPQTNEWYKTFEWESEEVAKNEITQLRELKNKQPEEIKFANDESKRLYELIRDGKTKEAVDVINTQERLQSFSTTEVNKENAADIIKLGMSLKNKNLTADEINFLYKQEYTTPKEPVYNEAKETEEEFQERHNEWKEIATNVEIKRTVAAKMAQPELAKLKTELVLPEINKQPVDTEAQQKELERFQKIQADFKQALESDFSKFDGYKAAYKDNEVELAAIYGASEEDKAALKKDLETLNIDEFLMNRWFNDGKPNIIQTMKDIQNLKKGDDIFQSGFKEGAAKMKEHYIKQRGNFTVNTSQSAPTFQPNANGQQQVSPFAKDAWSDKPPALVN